MADLWANEKRLIVQQNDELKGALKEIQGKDSGLGSSAVDHWTGNRGSRRPHDAAYAKDRAYELLNETTAKYSSSQEKNLALQTELAALQEELWEKDEELAETKVLLSFSLSVWG